jgi:hypothetical protein
MRIAALTLLSALALAAAGCGGDEKSAAPPPTTQPAAQPAPKRSAYANALNGLCAKRLASLEAIGNPTSPEELKQLLPKQLVVLRRFSADSKALRAGAAETRAKKDFDRFYATYVDGQIYALKTLKTNAFDGYFRVADSALVWQKQAEKTARKLGAATCAKRPFEDQAPPG